ncbi:ferredoxin [Nocardia arthritidis]|nr:(4Fe-4S)-binding protein [Nocardia arthritidis]
MRITADRAVCIGAGMCAALLPEVFGQDESGLVVVRRAESADMTDQVAEAIQICPSGALRFD